MERWIIYSATQCSEGALGDLASIAFKYVIREPVVHEADNAKDIPALIADLGVGEFGSHRLKHCLTFELLTQMPHHT